MSTPKITSRPGPKIAPNARYDERGFPVSFFEHHPIAVSAPPTRFETSDVGEVNVKILPNGQMIVGDVD